MDIRLDTRFVDHYKTRKLARTCGDSAVLCLIRLWSWAAETRHDGVLDGMDPDDVEMMAGWSGEQGCFVRSCLELEWLDEREDGVLVIHDWQDNQPFVSTFEKRSQAAKKAIRARWDKRTKNDSDTDGIRLECESNTDRIHGECESNTDEDTPLPLPTPTPIPDPKNIPSSPGGRDGTSLSPEFIQFAWSFMQAQQEQHGNKVPKLTDKRILDCADVLDKLVRIDGHVWDTAKSALEWARGDEFWSSQVLSLGSLRTKSKNGLHKFVNLLAAFEKARRTSNGRTSHTGFQERDYGETKFPAWMQKAEGA